MSESGHLGVDLPAFVGVGEPLSAELHERYARHLESCDECRQAALEAQRVLEATAAPTPGISDDFDARLYARLDAVDQEARVEARRERWRAFFSPARLALALSPVAAGLLWLAVSPPRTKSEDPAVPEGPMSAFATLEDLEVGVELELYSELDAAEYLDVVDDLEILLDETEAG